MEEKELLPIKDLTPMEALETLGEFPIWLPDRERFIKIKKSHEYKIIERELNFTNSLKDGTLIIVDSDNYKKLKALEVIKEKEVNVQNFKVNCATTSYEQYISIWECYIGIKMVSKTMLTKKEYDLLKEVLIG